MIELFDLGSIFAQCEKLCATISSWIAGSQAAPVGTENVFKALGTPLLQPETGSQDKRNYSCVKMAQKEERERGSL